MATAPGQPPLDIAERLAQEGPRVEFFQALRLLSRTAKSIRTKPELSLSFPSTDLSSIAELDKENQVTVTANFMGLYGVSSPLPTFYTEELLRDETSGVRDFLDIFHQRLYSLLFDCWKQNRLFIRAVESRDAAVLGMLQALCGSEDYTQLRYTGLLAARPRSALGLETMLKDILGKVPVVVIPFMPRAVKIPQDQQLHLGSCNTVLGQDSFIGKEFIDRQGKFRVQIGPLSQARFRALAQGGEEHERLVKLIAHYLTDALEYDFEFLMEGEGVRPACLGVKGASQLGLDTALFVEQFPGQLSVVFPPAALQERIAA